jgi:hypothetical protein
MNLENIISEIEKVDPEVYDRLDTRRKAMKKFANLSGKVALASLPLAFGSMLNTAYGRTTAITDVFSVLNFALQLEYLEAEFYSQIVGSVGYNSAPAADQTALTKIKNDENAHVAFLKTAISGAGGTPISKPNIDLTGGGSAAGTGPFAGFKNSYPVQLAMSQTFEDTGVRAYKGQATNLQGTANRPYLTAALEIHSVEARHAAKVRQMRRVANTLIPSGVTVKPWITLNQSGITTGSAGTDAAIQKSYDGSTPESNVTQAGVAITGIGGNSFITANAASEAFDEPLTQAEVLSIVGGFFY